MVLKKLNLTWQKQTAQLACAAATSLLPTATNHMTPYIYMLEMQCLCRKLSPALQCLANSQYRYCAGSDRSVINPVIWTVSSTEILVTMRELLLLNCRCLLITASWSRSGIGARSDCTSDLVCACSSRMFARCVNPFPICDVSPSCRSLLFWFACETYLRSNVRVFLSAFVAV